MILRDSSNSGNSGDSGDSRIDIIQWSNNRPCVFFVKDHRNNIHIWDLMASDMFPIYSIPFEGNLITDMKLSPIYKQNESTYMVRIS